MALKPLVPSFSPLPHLGCYDMLYVMNECANLVPPHLSPPFRPQATDGAGLNQTFKLVYYTLH